jgi:hypothetical protein
VMPLSEDMAYLQSRDIFSLRYPDHRWSQGLNQIAQFILNAQ